MTIDLNAILGAAIDAAIRDAIATALAHVHDKVDRIWVEVVQLRGRIDAIDAALEQPTFGEGFVPPANDDDMLRRLAALEDAARRLGQDMTKLEDDLYTRIQSVVDDAIDGHCTSVPHHDEDSILDLILREQDEEEFERKVLDTMRGARLSIDV